MKLKLRPYIFYITGIRSAFYQKSYLVKYLYKKYELEYIEIKNFIIKTHSENRGNRAIEFAF